MQELSCTQCNALISIETFLASVTGYSRSTNSSVAACPHCGASIEFQLRKGCLVIGYTYSSGSLHFEGLTDIPARGISCQADAQGVTFSYQGRTYRVQTGA